MDNTIRIKILVETGQMTAGVAKANASLSSLGATTGRIMRTMTAFFALFVARKVITGIADSVKQFAEFEKGIANIGILLDAERGRLDEFSQATTRLATTYGIATQDLLKAGFDIQSAVGDVSKSLDIYNAATKLAVAGGSDVASTTSGLLTLMENYGNSFRDAADATDLLFQAQVYARATIGELSSSSGKFLSTAAGLKIKVEELYAVFSQATRAMGGTKEAATALGMFLQKLYTPSEKLQALAEKQWKMSIQRAIAEKGLLEVMKLVGQQTVEEIGDLVQRQRAIKLLMAVLPDMNSVQEKTIGLINRTAIVEGKLAEQLDTTTAKLGIQKETWGAFFRDVGQDIAKSGIIEWWTDVGVAIKKAYDAQKEFDALQEKKRGKEPWWVKIAKGFLGPSPESLAKSGTFGKEAQTEQALTQPQWFDTNLLEEQLITVEDMWNQTTQGVVDNWSDSTDYMLEKYKAFLNDGTLEYTTFADSFKKMIKQDIEDGFVSSLKSIQTAFGTFATDIIVKGVSAGEAFKNMWQSVASAVIDWIAQMIAKLAIYIAMMAAAKLLDPFTGGGASVFAGTIGKKFLGFSRGGIVPGFGSGDRVPAMLEPGELIIPKDKVGDVFNNNPTINVSMAGALVLDDPNTIERLYREHLRDRIKSDIWTRRDRFYG